MIACVLIPGFDLKTALRARPRVAVAPAALAPLPGTEPLLGPVTAAAEAAGVRPGMRLGEALATCPALELVDQDPAAVEHEWEGIVRRLEDNGFAVEPVEPGCLFFDTRGVERLYGGVSPALKRALAAVGAGWDAQAGAADRRFAALAAASVARPAQVVLVSDEKTREFLAPLPLTLLPLERGRRDELERLGVKRIGQLAGLPGAAVAERLGPDGRHAWSLARGEERTRVQARRPPSDVVERLDFPEAVANELTLRRALNALLDRLLARPERGGRGVRKVALSARASSAAGHGAARSRCARRAPTAARCAPRSGRSSPSSRTGARARHRGRRARRLDRGAATAHQAGRLRGASTSTGRAAPGARERRSRGGCNGRRGRAVVADPRAASAARAARVNEPRRALVEVRLDGSPAVVNREQVAALREEWRVVDRWWTEQPVSRRYFEVVLESGRNVVVFRDEDAGQWFSQRGA